MYRSLISRIAVLMLLFAVIAKPCAGLFVKPALADPLRSGVELSLVETNDLAKKCKSKCLVARSEEIDSALLLKAPYKPSTGDWPAIAGLANAIQAPISDVKPVNISVMQKIGKRLAVLARLLL